MNTEIQTVTCEINGIMQEIPNLSPTKAQDLALVNVDVIQRLAALLPKANMVDIINEHRQRVRNVTNMADYVEVLENELAFHTTVNVLSIYKKESANKAVAA